MKIKSLFLAFASVVAGIYLTSPEGKKAREGFRKKKSTFEPVIKDLLKQAQLILDGAKEISSVELRQNIRSLTNSAKNQLLKIDLEKSLETIQEAIKVASKKIRKAFNETKNPKQIATTKKH